MNLQKIKAGENFPEDIYVIIEIPANTISNKYEIEKHDHILFIDRLIPTPMKYPCNYGYINHTLALDGDPIDVLVLTPYPLQTYSVIYCRPVGMLNMIDESGDDAKIIAVPHTKISKQYDFIKDIDDVPLILKEQIFYFFQHYKDMEDKKWVKILGWNNAQLTKIEIVNSFERAKKNNNHIVNQIK